MKKNWCIIFLIFIGNQLIAAEYNNGTIFVKTVTRDQKQKWGCQTCTQHISIDAESQIPDSHINYYTQPIQELCPNALVFIKNEDDTWIPGVTLDITVTNSTLQVHSCNNHTLCTKNFDQIRELLPYWQFQWQHRIPLTAIYKTLMRYITATRHVKNPFIEAKVIEPTDTIEVVGDLHGSSKSLREILKQWFQFHIIDAYCRLATNHYALFLGDYGDRTNHGSEVWNILATLKLINNDYLILCKGNHELYKVAKNKDFASEWQELIYGTSKHEQKLLMRALFNTLPYAFLLGQRPAPKSPIAKPYNFMLFVHGGPDHQISLHAAMLEAIRHDYAHKIVTECFPYAYSDISGFLWSDKRANKKDEEQPIRSASSRGQGIYTYNYTAVKEYLSNQSATFAHPPYVCERIISAHSHIPGGIARLLHVIKDGYEWEIPPTETTEPIQPYSVYVCTSSPEALGSFGCFEDSYATIKWDSQQEQWLITPHTQFRKPRRWEHVATL